MAMTRLGLGGDPTLTRQKVKPGTARRILPYARPYRGRLIILLLAATADAAITASIPVLLKVIIDDGILHHDIATVATVAGVVAGLALLDALMNLVETFYAAQIGQGVSYDLRMQVFTHIQRQPVAFFARAQTGSLVSRLNTDVVSAQQSIITVLSSLVSGALSLLLVLATMFVLSWQITLASLVIIVLIAVPARLVGRRLQRLTREAMQRNAEMGSLMNERFNVAGAMLVKLYGRPAQETRLFGERAGRVRDVGVQRSVFGQGLFIVLTLVASWATALVYGLGGSLVIWGDLQVGTLVALAALLNRIYGPVSQLSNFQVNVMTALVSFDRTFEVLDLKPLIVERPDAIALPANPAASEPASAGESEPAGSAAVAPTIEFDGVSFAYPAAREVSLASLESIGRPGDRRAAAAAAAAAAKGKPQPVLREVSFVAPGGRLTALVGPSGAGKTTITQLVTRMYDPNVGTVRLDGYELPALTLQSLSETLGVVTQDAHLFHETIRSNLLYARPEADEQALEEACRQAQIWDLIDSLPDGLDTVVGDRGYRLSGGEKQRIALARLLLKAPSVVILDEATAHLDSESEAAVQRALRNALAGRTSLVIAHRLSTVREADQILVVEAGRIVERGTHDELLANGGLYADLYHTQFAGQAAQNGAAAPAAVTE